MKKFDYLILALIGFFLGIFIFLQYKSSKAYFAVTQPENSAVLALEVAKLTKTNGDLRLEVKKLTVDLDAYKNSSDSGNELMSKYQQESAKLDLLNGLAATEGQGVIIKIQNKLSSPQLVDLINAIRNIGSDLFSINDRRIVINSDLSTFSSYDQYEIKVIGNSKLLKSAMERKGGIVEQIATKDMQIQIEEAEKISLPSGQPISFKYAKIVK